METTITIRESEIAIFPKTVHRPPAVWTLLAAWGCALFNFGWMVSINATPEQVLLGHVPGAAVTQQPIGRLDPSTRLDLALGLPLRNREQLTNLLQQIYQPAGANFRHYLSPEQFTTAYGPTEKD